MEVTVPVSSSFRFNPVGPLYSGTGAIKVTGSPFSTFVEAEAACNTMLSVLNEVRKPNRVFGNR